MSKVLQVLDLQNNQLEKLPDEIGQLKSLRVLYVHHNKLKKLPDSIGDLSRLQNLNISSNLLKELPVTISKLTRLKTLDISNNAKLKKLPKQLGHCHSLYNLSGPDYDIIQYPTANVCKEGIQSIMRFLAKGKFLCSIKIISYSCRALPPLIPSCYVYGRSICITSLTCVLASIVNGTDVLGPDVLQ